MEKYFVACLAALVYCANVLAAPLDKTVFGEITLGKPLEISQCSKDELGHFPAFNRTQTTCSTPGADNFFVRVLFPTSSAMLAKHGSVVVWTRGGNAEAAQFMTDGVAVDGEVMRALTQKYGKPTTEQRLPVQNRMGAVFEKHLAVWVLGEISVTYTSVFDTLERGQVVIKTNAGGKLIEEFEQLRSGPKRSL